MEEWGRDLSILDHFVLLDFFFNHMIELLY